MKQLNHILAATDLSAPARHAVERAAMVSQDLAATLDLLHVADLAPLERLWQLMGSTSLEMEERVLNAAQQKLHALTEALQLRFDVEARFHTVTGALLTELTKTADMLSTDLLVCGAKGESVIRHLVMGTTALRVLSTTTCPVLVVKQPPHEPYRRLLVPVDFSPSSLRAVRQARCIAPKAQVVLLHVFNLPFESRLRYASVDESTITHYRVVAWQEATQKLKALSEEAALSNDQVRLVVLNGDPTCRIAEQEQELDCDLLVMGKHGGNMVSKLLLGSVTKQVLAECQGDVLVSV